MSDLGISGNGVVSLVLGLTIVLLWCIPLWSVLLWMAACSLSWRWRAERKWRRFLVPLAVAAALVCGFHGLDRTGGLLGRPGAFERTAIYWVWLVQETLAALAVLFVGSARTAWGVDTVSGVLRKRHGRSVLIAWGVLAIALVTLRALSENSTPPGDWWVLAAVSGVLLALMVLVIAALLELRKLGRHCERTRTRSQ